MKAEDCKEFRRKIEETDPGEHPDALTMSHVRKCDVCLEFFERDMKLRQLVWSLSPVEAPADFDFRLRARIANEKVRSSKGFRFASLSFGIPTLTLAGLLLLTGLFLLLPKFSRRQDPAPFIAVVPVRDNPSVTVEPNVSRKTVTENVGEKSNDTGVRLVQPSRKSNAGGRKQSLAFQRAAVETKDSSAVGATVLRQKDSVSDYQIPLSFPLQTLTVSVDDGSGVSRTISFPTVSFGSQRVLTNSRSGLNPSVKGIW